MGEKVAHGPTPRRAKTGARLVQHLLCEPPFSFSLSPLLPFILPPLVSADGRPEEGVPCVPQTPRRDLSVRGRDPARLPGRPEGHAGHGGGRGRGGDGKPARGGGGGGARWRPRLEGRGTGGRHAGAGAAQRPGPAGHGRARAAQLRPQVLHQRLRLRFPAYPRAARARHREPHLAPPQPERADRGRLCRRRWGRRR